MNSGCAYYIGVQHDVCQDYAVAGCASGRTYAIVADGCSTSPDTDVGARVLAKTAEKHVAAFAVCGDGDVERFHADVVSESSQIARCLGLSPRALDATLLTAVADGRQFAVACCGDGVVAFGRRDGTATLVEISYSGGFPGYASYTLDAGREAAFAALSTNRKIVTRIEIAADGSICSRAAAISPSPVELLAGSHAEHAFVAIATDGAASFLQEIRTATSASSERVALESVFPEFLAFKNTHGLFVQRRARSALRNLSKRGIRHTDDFAFAAISLV